MTAYQITDWDEHYESAESRKVKRLGWVRVPNKHDGGSFCELLDHQDGMAHLGAWLLILQVASKMPVRGLLVDERGRALAAKDIARRTRGSVRSITDAIPRLIEAGWLEEVQTFDELEGEPPAKLRQSPDAPGCHPDSSGRAPENVVLEKRREEKKRGEASASSHPRNPREAPAAADDAAPPPRNPMDQALGFMDYDRPKTFSRWLNEHRRAHTWKDKAEWREAFDRAGWDVLSQAFDAAARAKDEQFPDKPMPVFREEVMRFIAWEDEAS